MIGAVTSERTTQRTIRASKGMNGPTSKGWLPTPEHARVQARRGIVGLYGGMGCHAASSVALNPKFARRVAPRYDEFRIRHARVETISDSQLRIVYSSYSP